jgi:hypothetical protein
VTVYLHWAWNASPDHAERKAAYASLDDAKAQAEHDLKLAKDSDDYTAAPLRITEGETGDTLWEPDMEA